jgi:predicted nucleotidyltransferase
MSTALQLGRTGWQSYVRRYAADPKRPAVACRPASPEIVARVVVAAQRIKSELGATRVVLFGSAVHGDWYGAHSDIDLAVEGLSGGGYWSAWRIVEDAFPDRRVDVVELESAFGSLRETIERDGITL